MTWVFIVITWLGLAEPYLHELPMDEKECKAILERITATYTVARENDPEFGFILKCDLVLDRQK